MREAGCGMRMPWRASSRRAACASHVVRHRLATNLGATRTATTLVGQPSAAIASATPAAVPPVPRGRTMVSGGSGVCEASSSPASRCPATARGWAPPPGIQRRAPSAPARRQARSTARGRVAGPRARMMSAARRAHAAATARLAAGSGCQNWARTGWWPRAAPGTAGQKQAVGPPPPPRPRARPPRRARRPQVRGRPARRPTSLPAAGRRVLQDPGQGAGGDRRGPGRAQQARVSYIQTPAALADAVATLRREPLVAADTEAASFHRYHDRIFLVQLASPSLTAIIDPLAIADLSPVGGLLDDPKVEKIFHGGDYGLRS